MDLWNNAVGRKYGSDTKSREELSKKLLDAMKNGELILDPEDKRQYKGALHFKLDPSKPVIVLTESLTGRNEEFYDTSLKVQMNREEFVQKIQMGKYPSYKVTNINGTLTPMSKRDNDVNNNLS